MSSTRKVVSARIRDVELKLPAARGEMARRFREFDWSATPIGPVEFWPESWRHAVQKMPFGWFLSSRRAANEKVR